MPPKELLLRVVVVPTHTKVVPVIDGSAFTVTGAVTAQPAGVVYVTVTTPLPMPDIIPEELPAVAIAGLLLVHTPPVIGLLNVVVLPWHTVVVPFIAAGVVTLTTIEAEHPATDV